MKKYLYILMSAVLMVFSTGCSSDEESQDDIRDYCYTGIVKYVLPETGYVQVVITYSPGDNYHIPTSPIIKGSEVSFVRKELTENVLQVDDIVEFKVIEYERVDIAGPSNSPSYFKCKVKPCK